MAIKQYKRKPPTVRAIRWGDPNCEADLEAECPGCPSRVNPENPEEVQLATSDGWVAPRAGDCLVLEDGWFRLVRAEVFDADWEDAS